MPIKSLQTMVVKSLDDSQAMDITLLDVHTFTTITDIMIICTGRSTRHVKSIADNLVTQAKKQHVCYLHIEGDKDSEWVLVDMGDIVVHVMLPAIRTAYNLEALWAPMDDIKTQKM